MENSFINTYVVCNINNYKYNRKALFVNNLGPGINVEIKRSNRLETRHYNSENRTVGFVAGHENLAEEIFLRLEK